MFEALKGRTPNYLDAETHGHYAVIAPFLPEKQAFLFEVRSQNLRRQPGEISFPGGKIEKGETPQQAALREIGEELLVPHSSVQLIAPLDIYTAPGMVVHPFLAELHHYQGSFHTGEVQAVFTVPFSFFLSQQPAIYQNRVVVQQAENFPQHLLGTTAYPWAAASYPVLFYQYENKIIWGMTARFMHNIVTLYKKFC